MGDSKGRKYSKIIVRIGLLAAGVVILGVSYFVYQAGRQKNALADMIRTNPDTAAVVVFTIDEDGQVVPDGSEIFRNADSPLVMASTVKTVILAAYADAVERGELNPLEQVPVSDLEAYYLPHTDGGAHAAGLKSLGMAVDEAGFASDADATVSINDIARIMIHHSGNAETDYLVSRIGRERLDSTMKLAGLDNHTRFRSVLGIVLSMFNHEAPLTGAASRQALLENVGEGDFSTMDALVERYVYDPSWRQAQLEYMNSETFISDANLMGWEGQVEASQLFPAGTAREYAGLLAQIATGHFISPAVSERARNILETSPADDIMRVLFHQRYGAKDGITSGVLTLASYAVPKRGPFAGETRVVVILANSLPYEDWVAFLRFQSIYLLQAELAGGVSRYWDIPDR